MTPAEYYALANERVTSCNLCGSPPSQWLTIAVCDRIGYPVQSVLCTTCGLIFITPRMPAHAYAEFYASGTYRTLINTYIPPNTPLEQSQANYAAMLCDLLGKFFEKWSWKGSTMLDIGGSTGVIAERMRDVFSFSPTVVEVSHSEASRARERGIETIECTAEQFNPAGRKWDIVTIFQSIDHFLDPRAVLTKAKSCVDPGGLFIIDIADVDLILGLRQSVDVSMKLDHPHGFTNATMHAMLHQCGFVVIEAGVSKEAGKHIYVCKTQEPCPGTGLPSAASVMALIAELYTVRMYEYYTSNAR
jgi:ubiquinone/menaquinone biosynthesis C-methylase UbiE